MQLAAPNHTYLLRIQTKPTMQVSDCAQKQTGGIMGNSDMAELEFFHDATHNRCLQKPWGA